MFAQPGPGPQSTAADQLDQHFQLPPVPRLLSRLLEVLGSARADATRAARVIERDPALSAEVLKVVNSAYYSLPRPVSELRFAIAYLGLGEVGRIALTLMTVDTLKPRDQRAAAALDRFWTTSYVTTLAARTVLRHVPGVGSSDDLYAAALLHRLGDLVYLRCEPGGYEDITRRAEAEGMLVSEAATSLGLPTPKSLGAHVARRWRLPAPIVRAAAFHDLQDLRTLPERGAGAAFDVAITVGSLVTEALLRPMNDEVSAEIERQVCRVMGWSREDFVFLLGEGEEWKLQAERFLNGAA